LTGRLHNNKGFTLVELAIAGLIMLITIMALYFMFYQGQVLLIEQDHRRLVFEMAQRRLVIYKALADNNKIRAERISGDEPIVRQADFDEDDESIFNAHYSVTVRPVQNAYYQVDVQYNWKERSGRKYQVKLVDCYPFQAQ
jgi:competence protein ComGC